MHDQEYVENSQKEFQTRYVNGKIVIVEVKSKEQCKPVHHLGQILKRARKTRAKNRHKDKKTKKNKKTGKKSFRKKKK